MNPGPAFEAAVRRSFGTAKNPDPRGVWVHKLADPPARRPDQQQVAGGAQVVRFSSPNPFDFMIVWPRSIVEPHTATGVLLAGGFRKQSGSHTLALECKSTAVPRLDFSALWSRSRGKLRPIQRDALADVAAAGGFAGVLWENRRPADYDLGPAVVFIPIATWLDHESNLGRKSLPWAIAVRDGIAVERDTARGKVKPYWRMPDLLRALEA